MLAPKQSTPPPSTLLPPVHRPVLDRPPPHLERGRHQQGAVPGAVLVDARAGGGGAPRERRDEDAVGAQRGAPRRFPRPQVPPPVLHGVAGQGVAFRHLEQGEGGEDREGEMGAVDGDRNPFDHLNRRPHQPLELHGVQRCIHGLGRGRVFEPDAGEGGRGGGAAAARGGERPRGRDGGLRARARRRLLGQAAGEREEEEGEEEEGGAGGERGETRGWKGVVEGRRRPNPPPARPPTPVLTNRRPCNQHRRPPPSRPAQARGLGVDAGHNRVCVFVDRVRLLGCEAGWVGWGWGGGGGGAARGHARRDRARHRAEREAQGGGGEAGLHRVPDGTGGRGRPRGAE